MAESTVFWYIELMRQTGHALLERVRVSARENEVALIVTAALMGLCVGGGVRVRQSGEVTTDDGKILTVRFDVVHYTGDHYGREELRNSGVKVRYSIRRYPQGEDEVFWEIDKGGSGA